MKNLIFFGIIFFTLRSEAYFTGDMRFGTFFETNTFYADEVKENDFAFLIAPKIVYTNKRPGAAPSAYSLQANTDFSYTKFMSNSNQDYFDYNINLKNLFRTSQSFQFYIAPKAKLLSEPALAKTEKRLERQFVGADLGFIYLKDSRRQYILNGSYEQEALSQNEYEHLNNQAIQGSLYYKKYFLPETFVYFGALAGVRNYPDGELASVTRKKYSSQRIEPGMGIEGRLTRYFKIRSYFGYSVMTYEKEVDFIDPVFFVELEEEISPRDYVLMGLDNRAEDSYFTNYQINQKVYIGYGRFIGDQILWVTKAEYLYRTYSRPQRRDDQRVIFDTRMEYSMSEKLKLEANFTFDGMSSDAVDPDDPPPPIDPSASYRYFQLDFYGKYLF